MAGNKTKTHNPRNLAETTNIKLSYKFVPIVYTIYLVFHTPRSSDIALPFPKSSTRPIHLRYQELNIAL